MNRLFSGNDPIIAGAELEGVQNNFKLPIRAGYICMEIAQAVIKFKLKVRFYNGVAWTKYFYIKDPDLNIEFDPNSAAIKCLFILQNQDFFPYPVYGVQIYYERTYGSADAEISNAVLVLAHDKKRRDQ